MRCRRGEGGTDFRSRTAVRGSERKAFGGRPRSEPVKWKIARAIRTETTVSLGWIARRLDLGFGLECLSQNETTFNIQVLTPS